MRPPGRRPGLPEARKFQVTPRKILFFVLFLFAVPLAVLMTALLSDIFCNQYHMCTKATAPAHPDADDDPDLTADHVVMETLDVPAGAQPETLLTPPSLTLEQYLATKRRDQPVIVALTNMGYADMASNFLCSMQRLGLNNTLMFATDLASYSYLTRLHYDVFYLNSSKSAAGATWGSKAFNTFVKEKVSRHQCLTPCLLLGFFRCLGPLLVWSLASALPSVQYCMSTMRHLRSFRTMSTECKKKY